MLCGFSYKQGFRPFLHVGAASSMIGTPQITPPVPRSDLSSMHAFAASSMVSKGGFFKNAMSRIRLQLPVRQNLLKITKAPHAQTTDAAAADLLKCFSPKNTLRPENYSEECMGSTLRDELLLDLGSSFMPTNLNNSVRKSTDIARLSSDLARSSLEMARKSTDSLDELLSDLLRGTQLPQKFLELKVEPERKSSTADLLQPAELFFKSSKTKMFSLPRLHGHEHPH
jgi:hypothetical protein